MTLTLIVGAAFLLALYYTIALLVRSDWNANLAGKAEFVFLVAATLVLGLAFARVLGWVPPDWLRGVVFLIIIGGLLVKVFTLTRIQNRRKARLAREREEINQ